MICTLRHFEYNSCNNDFPDQESLEKRKLIVKKIAKNNYRLLSTPYKSVNMLKNDYIKLKKFGFEDLEIFIND